MTPSWAYLMLIMTILGMKVGFMHMSQVCKTQLCTQNVTDHAVVNLIKFKKKSISSSYSCWHNNKGFNGRGWNDSKAVEPEKGPARTLSASMLVKLQRVCVCVCLTEQRSGLREQLSVAAVEDACQILSQL